MQASGTTHQAVGSITFEAVHSLDRILKTFPTKIFYKKLIVGNHSQSWLGNETGITLSYILNGHYPSVLRNPTTENLPFSLLCSSRYSNQGGKSSGVRNPIWLTNFDVAHLQWQGIVCPPKLKLKKQDLWTKDLPDWQVLGCLSHHDTYFKFLDSP